MSRRATQSLNLGAILAASSSTAGEGRRGREVVRPPRATAETNPQREGAPGPQSHVTPGSQGLRANPDTTKGSLVQRSHSGEPGRNTDTHGATESQRATTETRGTQNAETDSVPESHPVVAAAAPESEKPTKSQTGTDGANPQDGVFSSGASRPRRERSAGGAGEWADDERDVSAGDRVAICVSEEGLAELQRDYGGTTKGMLQCVGKTGLVTGRTARGATCVKFSSLAYRFNPRALLKVHALSVGHTVRMRRDLDLVKLLNKRVGYCSGMVETLGKVGTITKIDGVGDVTVEFGQSSFQYSPACCVPAPGATPDTVTATPAGEGQVVDGNSAPSTDGGPSDRQAFMQRLARMVKGGASVQDAMTSSGGDSSAISRLFAAIKDGNAQLVKTMCQSDPSLINKTHEGRKLTPLMYASWRGQMGVVLELLDMGADVNGMVTGSGVVDCRTPLSAALESGEEETAVLLLHKGADPRRASVNRRRTALHMAATGNHVQVVQMLLQLDVDVNAKDVFGDTPLIDALVRDSRATVDILLGLDHVDVTVVNNKGISALHAACLRSIPSAVEQILARDTSQVNRLMDGEYSPLHLAANDDCVEIIRLLVLNGGADVNVEGGGDHKGSRPILTACLRGHFPAVEALLDFGAQVNVADEDGDTPLHCAMGGKIPPEVAGQAGEIYFQEERVRIACTLIANGAFVDAENAKGRTCMRYGGPEVQGAVQDFMDRNRHLVQKKGRSGSGGDGRPTLVLRGVPLPCALCKSGTSDVTLLPCGHKTVCSACSGAVTLCPLCQCRVDSSTTDDKQGALFEAITGNW